LEFASGELCFGDFGGTESFLGIGGYFIAKKIGFRAFGVELDGPN